MILSGTPIQNTLVELWSLFDFVCPGRLGNLSMFQTEFCEPIRAGGYAGATALKIEIATRTAGTLQRIVRPYLLRRRKDQIQLMTPLPNKTEHVIFCKLTSRQRELYLRVLDSPEVEAVIQRRIMPFRAMAILRKLCNHPAMLKIEDTTSFLNYSHSYHSKCKKHKKFKINSILLEIVYRKTKLK
jgi:DNA excision repair protein ERCC-6